MNPEQNDVQPQPVSQPMPQPATRPQPVSQPMPQPATRPQPVSQAQPVSQPTPAPQPAAQPNPITLQGKQHVHHSYIWLGSLRALGVLIIAILIGCASSIASIIEGITYYGTEALFLPIILGATTLIVLLIFGIIAGISALAYKNLYYEIGVSEFTLYSGIISKKKVHVPYQRVQSVDQKASLIQRLFGVCNVSIDTAGGASNKAILVPYLTKQQAQTLRSELYTRKALLQSNVAANGSQAAQTYTAQTSQTYNPQGEAQAVQLNQAQLSQTRASQVQPCQTQTNPSDIQPPAGQTGNILDNGEKIWNEIGGVFAGEEVCLGPVTYEYGLSNKELVFTGLSNNASFAVAVIIVIAFICQIFSTAFEFVPESEDALLEGITASAVNYGIAQVSIAIIAGIIFIALIVWFISTLSTCLQYGGFHARRRGERIEVEHGLLQHQSQSVSIDRVQSVIIKQTFIRRILGYCELSLGKIDAADGSNSSDQSSTLANQGVVIHPFIKRAKVEEILNGIIPEFADVPTEMQSVSKKALRRGLIRRCILYGGGFWLALITAICQVALGALEPYMDYESIAVVHGISPVFVILYLLSLVIFVIDIVGTIFWARESGFAFNRRFMMIKNGGLSTQMVSFPRNKIQFGYTRTNPFQRNAHTSTIFAVTAAGVGGTSTQLIDVEQEDACKWLAWLEPYTK